MPMYPCHRLVEGGADYVETVLWENPSPTSAYSSTASFALSDSLANFDYVKVRYKGTTSSTNESNVIMSIADFRKSVANVAGSLFLRMGYLPNTATGYQRTCLYVDDTHVSFGTCTACNVNGTNNSYIIPLQILGLKKPTSTGETVLWTNSSPTSNFASQTVTLSDSVANYKYVKITWKGTTSNNVQMSYIVTTEDLRKCKNVAGSSTTPFNIRLSYASTSSGASYYWVRGVGHSTDTVLSIGNAGRIGGTDTNNACAIPLTISGIN